MKEASKLGDIYFKDAKAREEIEELKTQVGGGSSSPLPTEEWIFTLEDGTTVKKNVAVQK